MPMDLQLVELRALLLKAETVYGTEVAPAAATDGILVINGDYRFATDPLERQTDKVAHGARSRVNVRRRATFNGTIELVGAATVGDAAPIGSVLRACGFGETLTVATSAEYGLVTSGYESFTANGYRAGELIKGYGTRGVIRQIDLSIRNFATAQFEMMGLPDPTTPVADAAPPGTLDLSMFQKPLAIETESFEVDIGGVKLNALSLRTDSNAQVQIYEGSESRFVYPRGFYRPSGVLRVFKEQRTSWNPETKALSGAQDNLFATIAGGGKTVRLDLSTCEFGTVTTGEEEGIAVWEIPYFAVGADATDCLALSFTA